MLEVDFDALENLSLTCGLCPLLRVEARVNDAVHIQIQAIDFHSIGVRIRPVDLCEANETRWQQALSQTPEENNSLHETHPPFMGHSDTCPDPCKCHECCSFRSHHLSSRFTFLLFTNTRGLAQARV